MIEDPIRSAFEHIDEDASDEFRDALHARLLAELVDDTTDDDESDAVVSLTSSDAGPKSSHRCHDLPRTGRHEQTVDDRAIGRADRQRLEHDRCAIPDAREPRGAAGEDGGAVVLDFQPGGFWKAGGDRLPGVRAGNHATLKVEEDRRPVTGR